MSFLEIKKRGEIFSAHSAGQCGEFLLTFSGGGAKMVGPAVQALTMSTWSFFYTITGKKIIWWHEYVGKTAYQPGLKNLTSVFVAAEEAADVMKPEERESRA